MKSLNELKKIYKGKKVLITGHTGFKGVYMCILLKYLGAKIYGFALKEEKQSLYDILKKEIKIDAEKIADIRNYEVFKNFVKKVNPDFVLHMAAQPLVLKSYEEPRYTYDVNVMGTVNLFNAIKEIEFKKKMSILNVTTDKVYKNNDLSNYAFKEKDKLCGKDPYANSKSCSELVTYSYKKSFFDNLKNISISTARAGNVIGGGDINKNRIIPDAYRAIKNKKDMLVRNKFSIRPYQFVFEPLILYLNIMAYQYENKKYEGNYNIGPDKKSCLSTKDLVEKFLNEFEKIANIKTKIIYNKNKNNKKEAMFLRLDNSLIKKVFKYKEIYNMDVTIKYTAEIYYKILKNNIKLDDIFDIIKGTSK